MGAPYGQHFLANPHVAGRIAEALEISGGETVLEIGPGKGALTRRLLAAGANVIGIELDESLCRRLASAFPGAERLRIVRADALEADWEALLPRGGGPVKVAGNIPYQITSPLLERLAAWPGWGLAVLMVQEEVARRIAAGPGTRTYGVLSVGVQLTSEVRYLFGLSKNSFRPAPKVDSAVISFRRRSPAIPEEERRTVMKVVRAAFSQRRKTISNALSAGLGVSKESAAEALRGAGIDPGARAETVGLGDYRRLSGKICYK